MKYVFAALLVVASGSAYAKKPEPVSIGNGRYMMSDKSMTVFGSTDGIVAKLMKKANEYCHDKTGGEAELLDSSGSEAVPGELENGKLRRAAQGATGTIYFRCTGGKAPAVAKAAADSGRFLQIREQGSLSVQLTLPTEADCRELAGADEKMSCRTESAAASLPYRAILEDSASKDLLVVEAAAGPECEEFVSGMSDSGLTVVKTCARK